MRYSHRLVFLATLISGLVASPAAATSLQALSLGELVENAQQIIVGEVLTSQSHYDERGQIVTDHEVRVIDVWSGQPLSSVLVRSLGGSVGEVGMRVPGSASLRTGERYLLFLRSISPNRPMRCVGMSQGAMPVQGSAQSAQVLPGGAGAHLVQRNPQGQLIAAPSALLHAESLPRLRRRIQRLSSP